MDIQNLPKGAFTPAYPLAHFPAPHLAVIWRNWNRVAPARIAKVLGTTEENVVSAGEKMGLIRDDSCLKLFENRGYQTTIRYNWQLLNYEQLLQLLDWTPERLESCLIDDDFLYIKLGQVKPCCQPVFYRELTQEEENRCVEIAETMKALEARLPQERQLPFSFDRNLGKKKLEKLPEQEEMRMIFSYTATYGDIFLPGNPDPYPDALLRDYAASGINTIWFQGILHQFIPWLGKEMPLSARWEERLEGLRNLVARAKKYGIKLLLYLNEPRGIPARIPIEHEEWRGPLQTNTGCTAFCPWAPGMLDAMSQAIQELCQAVPDLGGFYTITMSENVTHCLSRVLENPDPNLPEEMEHVCPECEKHGYAQNVAAVMSAIWKGMKEAGTSDHMRLVAYTWSWSSNWDAELMELLPKEVVIMNVSEDALPTNCCGGYPGTVRDYSISKPGPSESSLRRWRLAQKSGHRIAAKIQANTSWELSGVPVIPVPTLVEEHLDNLRNAGVTDFMLSWSHGGFPGGNLELMVYRAEELAKRDFGALAPQIMHIWKEFGEAFRLFPFNDAWEIYYSPVNVGPANLLYPTPSGFTAGMVCGIPYDDLAAWRGHYYPEDAFEETFREISLRWGNALEKLRSLEASIPENSQAAYRQLWEMAEASYLFLRSTFCQIAFVRRRNAGQWKEAKTYIEEEISLAERMLTVCRRNSGIGFEAANQYYFNENELKEKILNCKDILARYCK